MDLPGSVFFVTGGCSGLGRAVVDALIAADARVSVADRDRDKGAVLARKTGDHLLFIDTDVSEETSIRRALDSTLETYRELHGLINCAGIIVAEKLLNQGGAESDIAGFRQCIEINLIGTFNVMRLACPILAANPSNESGECGVIINTASIAGYEGQAGQAAYAASKAGIIGLTLPLARELGPSGIRVMTIAPGVFATPLFAQVGDKQRAELERRIPFPARLGYPGEFAALALHIIGNPMLNGEVIRLDGALRL